MRLLHLSWTVLFTACIVAPAGCEHASNGSGSHAPAAGGSPGTYSGSYPIRVVCTTGMVGDVVRNVGGKHVEVEWLMGPRVDPHLYKAAPGDISRLSQADVIFYSGLHLEGKMADVFERLAQRQPAYAFGEWLPPEKLLTVGGELVDPHAWFDVALWSETVGGVERALCDFDPPHADGFKKNAADYRRQLAELDAEIRTELATIPEQQRVLVTAHDAFHYFGRAYGIDVRAIQGISTESEAGVNEINELVEFLVSRKIKAVFVESSVNPRNVEALVEGCKQRGHDVAIGGQLFSDALGDKGTAAETYIGMVRQNVQTIVEALK